MSFEKFNFCDKLSLLYYFLVICVLIFKSLEIISVLAQGLYNLVLHKEKHLGNLELGEMLEKKMRKQGDCNPTLVLLLL